MIDMLNGLGTRWAAYFTTAVVQNTVFLALIFLALHRLRHISARIRYAIGVLGIVKLLLPPFLPFQIDIGTADMLQQTGGFTGIISFVPAGGGVSAALRPETQLSVIGLLFTVWIAVVVVYILASIISTLRLASSLRSAVYVTGCAAVRFADGGRISVHKSDRIAVPMTLGIFPRKIFVPSAWDRWTDECRRMVLQHEAAHIARRDGLVQILQIIARALYFFHPLAMLLDRRVTEYREMACDDESAGRGRGKGVEYSRFLVEVAESIVMTPSDCESASALMKKKNELLNRVRYQMKGGAMMSKGKIIALFAALLLLVLPLSWYQTSAASEREKRQARTPQSRERGDRSVERPGRMPQQRSQRPTRPPAPAAVPAEPAKPAPPIDQVRGSIAVDVGASERVVIDGEEVAWAEVKKRLKKIVSGGEEKVVRLKCNDDTPMEKIHGIHELLREIGLDKIEYRNEEGYRAPLVLPPPDAEERLAEIGKDAIAELRVDASGGITLDGEPVEISKLSGAVMERLEKVPPLIVTVQTMKRTAYKDFLGVIAALKEADASRILIREPAGP
jgi:beta-lactamase regulating signal transducer with metallopeptidase domain/biopolymer transport protein ExbD